MAKAAEQKLNKKDLASGDSIAETLRPLAEGLQANWKTIVPVAGFALIVLVIVAVALEVQSHHREQAAQSVGDALALIARQVVTGEPADAPPAPGEKPSLLQLKKPELKPTKAAAKTDPEEFSSEAEKQTAIAKKAQVTIDQYGSQPAGRVALLTLADAQYRLGEFQHSVDSYQKFLGATPDTDYLKAFGQVGLAWAYLALNKGDDALSAAKALSDHPPAGFGKDLGLLAQGEIAEDLGKVDAAKEAYRTLRNEAGDSAAGRQANERLTFLGEPPATPTVTVPVPAAP